HPECPPFALLAAVADRSSIISQKEFFIPSSSLKLSRTTRLASGFTLQKTGDRCRSPVYGNQ
ncbi:MAG: hypothetical protein IKQ73_06210, partial [Oscillospiraceae bacterium]|nr:hypothetical protein [Oscillospiraceae bacterium]